mgnify:CR=1 FL=1
MLYVDDTVSNVENAKRFGLETCLFADFGDFFERIKIFLK